MHQWFTPLRFGIALSLALFACFPQVWMGTASFFLRDYGALGYPFIHHARESFWRGELPLWNPLSNCGAPFLAQWGTMSLYPFSLIYLLAPLPWGLSAFCFAHLVLAGVGMYRLADRWTGNGLAAGVAGGAYVFSGFMFACLTWPNYLVALGWMPWIVWLAERAWREGGSAVILAALAATMQMLVGVPEIVLLTWMAVGSLWLADLFAGSTLANFQPCNPSTGSVPPGRFSMSLRLIAVVALTAGLAAAQLLPFFDLLAHSQREHGAIAEKWAMPVSGWANLLVPLFHCLESPRGQFFQPGQEFFSSYYLGGGVLVLAVAAVCGRGGWRVWLLAGLALFSLVMALGSHTPIYGWFKQVVPVVGLARYPVKFVALAAFVVPLLAAFGVRRLLDEVEGVRAARTIVLVALAVLLAMAGVAAWGRAHPIPFEQTGVTTSNAVWRGLFLILFLGAVLLATQWGRGSKGLACAGAGAAMVVLAFDALTHSPRQNPTLPVSVFTPGFWRQAFQAPPPRFGESRLMISPQAERALLHSSVKDHQQNFFGKRLAEWSNLNVLDGIPKVNGATTLQLREQMQVQTALYALTNRLAEGLMDFLGVSQFSAPGQVVEWAARTNHLPLITVGQKPVFVDGTNALPRLLELDFDPREVVFLPQEVFPDVTARERVPARILSTNIAFHRLEFEVETKGPCLAVIAQSYYHPWEVRVDGAPARLWRANHAFQALEVPDGRHTVVVAYRDRNLQAGGAVSLATLLGCGLYGLRRRRNALG